MMTTIYRGLSLAAVAVITVALMAGPAHARGLRTATVELLPVDTGNVCDESFEDTCNANANASAVTAKSFGRDTSEYTLWTAIADDLWPETKYGLYSLRSPRTVVDLQSGVCVESERVLSDSFKTNVFGQLAEPTTIGTTPIHDTNVVYVCRLTDEIGLPAEPVLILSGELTGGASSGGKNNNRRNQ